MIPYSATTEQVTVTVRPAFLDGQSDVVGRRFVFGYFIHIENHSTDEVQLLRRHWYVYDANGKAQEVEGEGVIGEQPILPPGGTHDYNSFVVLETFTGAMEGTYLMQRPNGERFRIAIPRFHLTATTN